MEWLNEPASWQRTGDVLTVSVDPGTDFWRETGYGYIRDSGHVYGEVLAGDLDVSVRVRGVLEAQFDQAGIMVRADEQTWIKTGVEFFEGRPRLSTVLTLGKSSWMVTDLPEGTDEIGLRVSRRGDAVEVRYVIGDGRPELAALVYMPPGEQVLAGVMCAAPEGPGFRVTFNDLQVTEPGWSDASAAAGTWQDGEPGWPEGGGEQHDWSGHSGSAAGWTGESGDAGGPAWTGERGDAGSGWPDERDEDGSGWTGGRSDADAGWTGEPGAAPRPAEDAAPWAGDDRRSGDEHAAAATADAWPGPERTGPGPIAGWPGAERGGSGPIPGWPAEERAGSGPIAGWPAEERRDTGSASAWAAAEPGETGQVPGRTGNSGPPWDSEPARPPTDDRPGDRAAGDRAASSSAASDGAASDGAASDEAGAGDAGRGRAGRGWARRGQAAGGGPDGERASGGRVAGDRIDSAHAGDSEPAASAAGASSPGTGAPADPGRSDPGQSDLGRPDSGRTARAMRDEDSVWRPSKDDDDPNWARDLAKAVEDTDWDISAGEDEPGTPGGSGGARPGGAPGAAAGRGEPAGPADPLASGGPVRSAEPERGLFEPMPLERPVRPASTEPDRADSAEDSLRQDSGFHVWAATAAGGSPARGAGDYLGAPGDADAVADWDRLAAGVQAGRGRGGRVAERWTAQTDADVANEWPGPPLRAARQAAILNQWTVVEPSAPATSAPAPSAPVQPAPVQPAPVQPAPAASAPAPRPADQTLADGLPGDAGTATGTGLPAEDRLPNDGPPAGDKPAETGLDGVAARSRRDGRPPLDLPVPQDPADEWISLLTADPAED